MDKIKIIKKNDEYSSEYQIGDTFKIEGTWNGGVHIIGKTGAPVSLDKDEYIYLDADQMCIRDRSIHAPVDTSR